MGTAQSKQYHNADHTKIQLSPSSKFIESNQVEKMAICFSEKDQIGYLNPVKRIEISNHVSEPMIKAKDTDARHQRIRFLDDLRNTSQKFTLDI